MLGFSPVRSVLWSCLYHLHHPLGTGSLVGAATGSQEPAAVGWAASTSTLQRDIRQRRLPLERLQAVPGRVSHLSQEEIKLLELRKRNLHGKCVPCGLHVETVLPLTQPELTMAALNNHFGFSWWSR